jgi:hypothetical protein
MPVALKIFLGVICFGIVVGLAVGSVDILLHPDNSGRAGDLSAWGAAMFGGMFLLGSYFVLRRPKPPIG